MKNVSLFYGKKPHGLFGQPSKKKQHNLWALVPPSQKGLPPPSLKIIVLFLKINIRLKHGDWHKISI